MDTKVKLTVVICTLLLVGLGFGSFDLAPAQAQEGTVTYDYYVVAGYNMTPTPPEPAQSPPNFTFTCDPPVYNFGNITYTEEGNWLYEGTMVTRTGSAYAKVDITNLLGYDITITNLTAEITAGTPTLHWYFPLAEEWFGNYTLLQLDRLDPWVPEAPWDEVDYTTGEVTVVFDGDWSTMAVGIPYPRGEYLIEPVSLLEPDYEGDAEATGHVAPTRLANGSTFTEYFGMAIFGVAEAGTQINGTITLSLTYTTGAPAPEFPWLWLGVGVVVIVVVVAVVTAVVKRRK